MEYSFPFDSGAGASLTQDQWSEMARWWVRPGVPSSAGLTVTTSGTILATTVTMGYGNILGHFYKSDANIVVTHEANNSGLPRLDLVVLRLDMNTDRIYVPTTAVTGTPATNPVAPNPAGDYDTMTSRVWEIPLAVVRVEPSALTIGADKINSDFRWRTGTDITTGIKAVRPNHYRFRPSGHIHFDQDTETWVGRVDGRWIVLNQSGPYTSYTPVVTYEGRQPKNAFSNTGYWRWMGDRTIHYKATIQGPSAQWVNDSVVNFMQISLPFAADSVGNQIMPVFHLDGFVSATAHMGIARIPSGASEIGHVMLQNDPSGNLDYITSSYSFASQGYLIIEGTYIAAQYAA